MPPSFVHETFVEFGGERWKLVSADPFEHKDYVKTGKVRIGLKRVKDETGELLGESLADLPAEKLFLSASRAAIFPDFSGSRSDKPILEMAAWEWRQVELVPESLRTSIGEEFTQVEQLKLAQVTVQDGREMYRKQHVRSASATALLGKSWKPERLRTTAFTFSTALDGLSFMGEKGLAEETFVFRMPSGIVLYGLADGGKVRCLGLRPAREKHDLIAGGDLNRLVLFLEKEELILVDWERLLVVEPNLAGMGAYLGIESPEAGAAPTPEAAANAAAEAKVDLPGPEVVAIVAPEVVDVATETGVDATSELEDTLSIEMEVERVDVPALEDDSLEDMAISLDLEADLLVGDVGEEE